ncbi:NUDIX hydrolase [Bradyrhizobium oligotrophicum S58]
MAEVELYYVDSEHIPLIGHIEQLTWIHVSLPLAVEALARSPDLIDTPRAEEVWFKAALDLASRSRLPIWPSPRRCFSEFGLTEPIFPTTYGCAALASAEEWLRHYKQAPAPELSPPPTTRLIRKAGAAIIEDGRILLVRKFKTDLFIMPGGGVEDGEQIRDALRRELLEELGCRLALIESEPIGVYRAPAAFEAGFEVEITLFLVRLRDRPSPHSEIEEIIWHAPSDDQAMLSPIVKELIIPGLCALKLL